MAEPLVIVGKGMAATRLVDELSQRALGRYAIAVIGAEDRLAYNRVLDQTGSSLRDVLTEIAVG